MDLQDMPFDHEQTPPIEEETKLDSVAVLERAKRYGILNAQKKRLKAELELTEQEMTSIQEEIADTMILENPQIKVKIGEKPNGEPIFTTVHTISKLYAGHNGDKEALIRAMKQSGLEDMIAENFNANTFAAYIRGLDPDKKMSIEELMDVVPELMRPYMKISKVVTLGCKG